METVKCPLAGFVDQEVPLYILFDTGVMKDDVVKSVGKIFLYMVRNSRTVEAQMMWRMIKANIGEKNAFLLKRSYLDTYKGGKLRRYLYFSDTQHIYSVMDSFEIIYSISESIWETARQIGEYYKIKQYLPI